MTNIDNEMEIEKYFDEIVEAIQEVYNYSLSEFESRQAARNLIGFVKTLLEIIAENCENLE